jgi:hypothetical protein
VYTLSEFQLPANNVKIQSLTADDQFLELTGQAENAIAIVFGDRDIDPTQR